MQTLNLKPALAMQKLTSQLAVKPIIKCACCLLSLMFLHQLAKSQPIGQSSSTIFEKLQKIETMGSVLYIGVTPADEDIDLLAYLSKGRKYRTGFLSITRGENLKNARGYERGVEEGIIHVAEGAMASVTDDIERYYTRAYDISFVSNKQQVHNNWNEEKILSDLVWVIRTFQPNIIISKYSKNDVGYGLYTAVDSVAADLITQAYYMAADSMAFKDQLAYGASIWQAKRLLFDGTQAGASTQTAYINIQQYSAITGASTGDIGLYSKQFQKTVYYRDSLLFKARSSDTLSFMAGDTTFNDFMDGCVCGGGKTVENMDFLKTMDSVLAGYDFTHPEKSVPGLITVYGRLQAYNTSFSWKSKKLAALQDCLFACTGLKVRATSAQLYAIPGDSLRVNLQVNNNNWQGAVIKEVRIQAFDTSLNVDVACGGQFELSKTIPVSQYANPTQPYWLRQTSDDKYAYQVDDQFLIGRDNDFVGYTVLTIIEFAGRPFMLSSPVIYRDNNALSISYQTPVSTLLPVIVSVTPDVVLTNVKPENDITKNQMITVAIKSNITDTALHVKIKLNQLGFKISVNGRPMEKQGDEIVFEKDTVLQLVAGAVTNLAVPVKNLKRPGPGTISNVLGASVTLIKSESDRKMYSSFYTTFNYSWFPQTGYFLKQTTKIVSDEIKTARAKIGFLNADADRVFTELQPMGYDVTVLSAEDLTVGKLAQFGTVVAGSNIDDLALYLGKNYDSIVSYVFKGGNLLILGQDAPINITSPFVIKSIVDYRTALNDSLVIDSTLPVSIFKYPNAIRRREFSYWKGTFGNFSYPAQYAPGVMAPILINNKSNGLQNAALLIKKYGKGYFIVTSLSLSPQLANGAALGYRLLANLLALKEQLKK